MKVLVTGGTGFLGRRLLARLAPKHEVRALVRPSSDRSRLPDGIELVTGDVTDRASLEAAAAGCDAMIHAAALVAIMAPRERFDAINVAGFDNVLAAAENAGVGKLVYVSSFMALGPSENGPNGMLDETATPGDRNWINDYERTKTFAERAARAAIERGLPVNVVYPTVIYGPGELTEGNIVVRHILDIVHGKLPGLIGKAERRWNYAFVEDVAHGIELTLEKAPAGGRYVIGGENVSQADFYRSVHEHTGVKPPGLRFPDPLAKAAGAMMKLGARLTKSVPQLTPDLVDVYKHDWAFDSSRAERELGYDGRSLSQGLETTIAWLRETDAWRR
ncbi:MAG: NAD-dependent epimerase/dehydratase family protein [Acidobacteriota bacterium]